LRRLPFITRNNRPPAQLNTKKLLLQAVECLADSEKYPSKYNQTFKYDAMNEAFFGTLADRLARVHQELGDQAGAEVWQEKMKHDNRQE